MRKFSFCILLISLGYNIAIAQRFKAGLLGGVSANDVAGTNTRGCFHKVGILFGGLVNAELSKKNSLQFEINYAQKGSLQRPDSLNMGYFNLYLNYIEVPVLFKRQIHFMLWKKPMDRICIEGGASVSRLFSFKMRGEDNYDLSISESMFNKTLANVFVGLDFNFTPNFYFCFRYNNSVIPAVKRNALDWQFIRYTYNQGNNQNFQFTFKYVFGNFNQSQSEMPPKTE